MTGSTALSPRDSAGRLRSTDTAQDRQRRAEARRAAEADEVAVALLRFVYRLRDRQRAQRVAPIPQSVYDERMSITQTPTTYRSLSEPNPVTVARAAAWIAHNPRREVHGSMTCPTNGCVLSAHGDAHVIIPADPTERLQ